MHFDKISKIKGELKLPGDKSISHRAVIFSSIAQGKSVITNLSNGEDVKSTINCFEQLGVDIKNDAGRLIVEGKGLNSLSQPKAPLDSGNSGTTARLISGILIHQKFRTTLIGDDSLSLRPMKRIITPLNLMGGKIEASGNLTLPLKFSTSENLVPINYELPIASAQIKSAVLLSGLHLNSDTTVVENIPSRNHTEAMLGLPIKTDNSKKIITINSSFTPQVKEYFIPSDISTAAFFIVLTLLSKNSELLIKNVTLNHTRTGILEVLRIMGGSIETVALHDAYGEPYGDILIKSSRLQNIKIDKNIVPNIIDEIPILAVAGAFADGGSLTEHAAELRAKETDRIKAICYNLTQAGLRVDEFEDGFKFSGKLKNKKFGLKSFGDHRIAMSGAVLSMLNNSGGEVEDFECVNISNPQFLKQLKNIIRS
ncbi:MAG: 3-phosphoshikimate 1-carboxyvinyltransferase [Ignavibacteriaceae bacterium]|nr:3-phosphoshikimate 1-carboxyvinyltransferase [Ignavibacteriaceae bacterium]